MTGVAAILDPHDKKKILVFTRSKTKQIALTRYDTDGQVLEEPVAREIDEEAGYEADPENGRGRLGVIRNPSQLVAMNLRGQVRVFGIREDGVLCVCSPEFCALKTFPHTTKTAVSLAGCQGEGELAWLYYIPDKEPDKSIMELATKSGSHKQWTLVQPLETTSLAAFLVQRKKQGEDSGQLRWVVYQDDKGIHAIESNNKTEVISGAYEPRANTPLAACVVNGDGHVFWADKNSKLVTAAFTDEWQVPKYVEEDAVESTSDISAVVSEDKKNIYLFYVPKGNLIYGFHSIEIPT